MLVADYEKQYEEYRNTHPLKAIEQNDPKTVKARKDSEKLAEEARNPQKEMSAELGGYRDATGRFIIDPMVQRHMEIAMTRAERQFMSWSRRAMPEDTYAVTRFPDIDPMGKFSIIDMKIAYGEDRIRAALNNREADVRGHVTQLLLQKGMNEKLRRLEYDVVKLSQQHRTLTRAAKLCLDPAGRVLLEQKSRELESTPSIVKYNNYMLGMEYAAGIKTGPIPQEVLAVYGELGIALDQRIVEKAQRVANIPAEAVEINYADLDNKLLQQLFSMPEHWDKSSKEIEKEAEELGSFELVEREITPYAKATTARVLDPLFTPVERASENSKLNRGDLIIIDGKTVRELLFDQYAAEVNRQEAQAESEIKKMPSAAEFEQLYLKDDNYRQQANALVSAALMAGKRVEMFVPDASGKLPDEPVQVTKTGYEPSPLKKVTLNAWERYFSKYGFFKEKVKQAADYQRMAEARERVKADYFCKHYVDRSVAGEAGKEMFFGNYMREHDGEMPDANGSARSGSYFEFSATRTAYQTIAIGQMLKDGYGLEDILDPQRLRAEKLRTGDRVSKMLDEHRVNEVADALVCAQSSVVEYMDRRLKDPSVLLDPKKFMSHENDVLMAAVKCAYDAVQEAQRSQIAGAYQNAFRSYMQARDPGATEQQALFDPLSTTSQFIDYMVQGIKAGVTLSSGEAAATGKGGQDFVSLVNMQAVRQVFREASEKQPETPLSRLLTHKELENSRATGFSALMFQLEPGTKKNDFSDLHHTVEMNPTAQKLLGRELLFNQLDERMSMKLDPDIVVDYYDDSTTFEQKDALLREKLGFELKAVPTETKRFVQAQKQQRENVKKEAKAVEAKTEKLNREAAKAKAKEAPERGRSR